MPESLAQGAVRRPDSGVPVRSGSLTGTAHPGLAGLVSVSLGPVGKARAVAPGVPASSSD
ncbi:hypothetical protein [Micromonospora sp. NBRC 107095]|uniref:hypothetical protein n=1 Tax=Micromonospora TaxID=1873 RepID=UPI0024A5109C|nr:hypothetical protein [Micromonospora sp. NBRC 107095]GLZ62786.1 hypothetical protein Misp05_63620 [Micromonospora sp. NBRC 107095]